MLSNCGKIVAMIAFTTICVVDALHAQTEPNFQQIKQTTKGALIIVNGKEVDDLDSVPVESVESFSVLNAQSATKLYGERGKNGVVIVSTKPSQSLEEKAALLACECIKKLENADDEKSKECISNSLLKVMEESGNSEEISKLNVTSTISKVEALTNTILRSTNAPEDKVKTSINAGYESPQVKQELLNDQPFLTIEEIGKHLSELLINRMDINKSPLAINIDKLFPNEDFSEYKDSPAMFIVSMLYGSQQLLPQTWKELLLQADSLNVNKNAKYLKTYYIQKGTDNFTLTCVLKQSSKYYAFSSIVLGWENDKYVMRIFKKMKVYKNKKELKKNLFSIVIEENLEELKEMEMEDDTGNPDIESFKQGFKQGLEQRLNKDRQ